MPPKDQSTLGKGLEHFFEKFNEDELFSKALSYDESGNYLYAFHYYMKVIEFKGQKRIKALNNASVILFEHGFKKEALEIVGNILSEIGDAVERYEGYEDLIENLKILRGEE